MECPSYPSKLNHQPTFLSELTKVTVQLSSNPPSSDLYGGNSDGAALHLALPNGTGNTNTQPSPFSRHAAGQGFPKRGFFLRSHLVDLWARTAGHACASKRWPR